MTYPDLQHEVAERVRPPGFDEVVARAAGSRRRRRTTIGAGLAAVVVVGGLAVTVSDPGGSDGRSDGPAAPTTTWDGSSELDPLLPAEVRDVLDDDTLQHWTVAGSGGAVAVVWRGCDEECHFVLTTGQGDEVSGRVLPGGTPPRLAPVPGGWLLEAGDGFSRIAPSGAREPVYEPAGGAVGVAVGDTAVETSSGWALLRGDKLLPVPVPDDGAVQSAYVTPEGRLVEAVAGPGSRWELALLDPGAATPVVVESRAYESNRAVLAGHGDHVVLALLGDEADGAVPVTELRVSHDAGMTWTEAVGPDPTPRRDLSGLTVTDAGTAFLTTSSHGVVRVGADGDATASRLSSYDAAPFLVAERVCVVSEAPRVAYLQCSTDDGATWAPAPLPGFR